MVVPQEGTLLSWEDTQKYADHVRKQGVKQFIRIYHKVKDRSCETFKWGDEVGGVSSEGLRPGHIFFLLQQQ